MTAFGSFGDVHPYMALALELQRRGHAPVIATSELYRQKILEAGLEFFPVRPDLPPPDEAGPLIERVTAGANGTKYLFKDLLMPNLRGAYEDLTRAVQGADLMVAHIVPMAAPMVAEKTGIPWISTVLAPVSFFSAYDPSVPPLNSTLFMLLSRLGPRVMKPMKRLGERVVEPWIQPIYDLRRELGLPRGAHPMFGGQHSPQRVLALFSPLLGAPQPDWPPETMQTGFCFYDKRGRVPGASDEVGGDALSPALEAFLQAGDAPIVFTLGSSVVLASGDFYEQSAQAAKLLNRRAVLLVGDARGAPQNLPEGVAAFDYAPYSEIFPRAAAIVHSGGVGTTAQAMRAGKPMLIMPFSNDQPDHAYRMARLGIGRGIARYRYNATNAARELDILLSDENYAARGAEVGSQVRAENGVARACDEIEGFSAKSASARD